MHAAAAKALYGSLWVIFNAEWIKTSSSYYGGLASGDWLILKYSGPWSLKAEVTSKGERWWKDLLKCHCAVSVLNFAEHKVEDDRMPTRRGLLFTVVAKRMQEIKKNAVFIVSYIINQSMWCAYKTPTVLENCLQLCCRSILIFGLSTFPCFTRVSEGYFVLVIRKNTNCKAEWSPLAAL